MHLREKFVALLRWSERYTKTDMVYLAEGSFWLTLSKVLGIGASFLTSIAFANLLPEETYGIYRYVLSVMTILVIPTLGGIDAALTRVVARGSSGTIRPAFRVEARWGLLGTLASVGLAGYYFFQGNSVLALSFLIASVFIPVMDPANIFLAYLSGKKNFKSQTYSQTIIRAGSSLCIILTVFITDSITTLLLVYFSSYTFLRLAFFLVTLRKVPRGAPVDLSAISYGKHLTLMKVPGIISAQLDKILVFHYIGGAALAGYYLALLPFKQMQNLLGSVNVLALPNFSLQDTQTLKATLPRKMLQSYAVIIPVLLLYILLARFFFTVIYPQYTDFVLISQLFMLQLLFFPLSLFNTAITAIADKRKLYIQSTVIPTFRIVAIATLVPLYGIGGGVTAILATSILNAALTIYLFAKLK